MTAAGGPSRSRRRRRRTVLLIAAVAFALAGCGGLPTSSDVVQGSQVAPPVALPPRQRPAAPEAGASPEAIVLGFLAAGSALTDDYRASRAYLAPGLAERWSPRSRTTYLYSGGSSLRAVRKEVSDTAATVQLSAPIMATVDTDGRYSEGPLPQERTAILKLGKVGQEWRIQSLPDDFALWLDMFYFDRYYAPFSVAYVSPVSRLIVPDRRFFPVTSSLQTTLARAQLDPIPGYLQGALTTGFPPLTRLAVDAVPVDSGQAVLELTEEALGGSADDRRAAAAQALTTMTQTAAVAGVSLQVNGRPLELVGVPDAPRSPAQLGFDVASGGSPEWLVVRTGAALSAVRNSELRGARKSADGPVLPAVDPAFDRLAASPDLRDLAAVSGDGRGLLRWQQRGASTDPGTSAVLPAFGTDLIRPSYDDRNHLWIAGVKGDSAAVWAIDIRRPVRDSSPQRMAAQWLSGRRIVAVEAAPDGHRLALLLTEADGRLRVAVTGVIRNDTGDPIALTNPLLVGGRIVQAEGVAWAAADQLAVLGRTVPGQEYRALIVGLDGRTAGSELPGIPGATAIAALGPGRLAVTTARGRVLVNVAGGWQEALRAGDLVVP